MIISGIKLAEEISNGNKPGTGGISIVPEPDISRMASSGDSSIDLRLGRWFLSLRQARETHIDATPGNFINENKFGKQRFVPFGSPFILHPGRFVLASTLEWIKMPAKYAAFVVGKSSLGRRGVIIETAAGVHPGFSGCLTLEIGNIGEIPVKLISGMRICQLFVHDIKKYKLEARSRLAGQRKPRMGQIGEDKILEKLVTQKL